jgi:hypothetical protein
VQERHELIGLGHAGRDVEEAEPQLAAVLQAVLAQTRPDLAVAFQLLLEELLVPLGHGGDVSGVGHPVLFVWIAVDEPASLKEAP